jgi:hypothetical protein
VFAQSVGSISIPSIWGAWIIISNLTSKLVWNVNSCYFHWKQAFNTFRGLLGSVLSKNFKRIHEKYYQSSWRSLYWQTVYGMPFDL